MKLNEFIHFNKRCPVCDNDLTLYMQMVNSVCFRAIKNKHNIYHFEPYKCLNKFVELNDYIDLYDFGKDFDTKFSNSRIAAEAKRVHLYFFYMCNENGFENIRNDSDTIEDYTINMYDACYYRSTPIMEYQKTSKKVWTLKVLDPDMSNLVNQDEIFSFSRIVGGIEKVYMLNMDYRNDKTIFMHYSLNEKQREDKNFSPNVFEKEMPALRARPNFSISNRDNLIDRFDSWIIIS